MADSKDDTPSRPARPVVPPFRAPGSSNTPKPAPRPGSFGREPIPPFAPPKFGRPATPPASPKATPGAMPFVRPATPPASPITRQVTPVSMPMPPVPPAPPPATTAMETPIAMPAIRHADDIPPQSAMDVTPRVTPAIPEPEAPYAPPYEATHDEPMEEPIAASAATDAGFASTPDSAFEVGSPWGADGLAASMEPPAVRAPAPSDFPTWGDDAHLAPWSADHEAIAEPAHGAPSTDATQHIVAALHSLADRIQRGEIQVPAVDPVHGEAGALVAALSALLGIRS